MTFANQIAKLHDKVRSSVRTDGLLTKEDIKSCVQAVEFANCEILGLWVHGNRVNPSLSFYQSGEDGTITFAPSSSLQKKAGFDGDVAHLRNDPQALFSEHFVIKSPATSRKRKAFRTLLDCVSLISRRSANATNLILSQNVRIAQRISSIVHGLTQEEFVSVLGASGAAISQQLRARALLIRLSSEGVLTAWNVHLQSDNVYDGHRQSIESAALARIQGHFAEANLHTYSHDERIEIGFIENVFSELCLRIAELEYIYASNITAAVGIVTTRAIIQPISIGGERKGERYFYVFLPDAELKNRDVHSIAAFSSAFSDSYRQKKKIQLLAKRSGSDAALREDLTKTRIHELFDEALRARLDDLFSVLRCHSLTVRLYNSARNSLELIAGDNTLAAEAYDSLDDDQRKHIPLSAFRTSVNAFTFLVGNERDEFTYIRNLNTSIPSRYKNYGLEKSLRVRQTSRSEICLPFRFGTTVIGTMNLESPVRNGFDQDIEFLLSYRDSLEHLYRQFFQSFDMNWYRALTRFADPLHELENYLDTDIFNSEQKIILRDLFLRDNSGVIPIEQGELSSLRPWFEQWVRSFYSKESEDIVSDVLDIVEFNIVGRPRLPDSVYDTVTVIIRNLIKNVEDHSDIRRDKIIVSNTARYRNADEAETILRIRFKTFGYFAPGVLETMCLKPILKTHESGSTRHYGAYILGLLVRSVGGFVTVDEDPGGAPVVIEFSIPMNG